MQIRPKILLRYGRINEPVRIPMYDLLVDAAQTFITVNTAIGVATLTVKNITGFAINQVLLIGEPGNEGSEIINTDPSVAPSGSTITLSGVTLYPHSANTKVYILKFNQVEISNAPTVSGVKSVLATTALVADSETTDYNDLDSTGGYYFARFKNSIATAISTVSVTAGGSGYAVNDVLNLAGGTGGQVKVLTLSGSAVATISVLNAGYGYTTGTKTTTGGTGIGATINITALTTYFSPYSDAAPYNGYTKFSARSIIDKALSEINKGTSQVLNNELAFNSIDDCQTECIRELKRWSFMEVFNAIIGQTHTGSWKVAVPTDLDDQFSNKSVWHLKIGTEFDMDWVDKDKWDELTEGVAYTTLKNNISVSNPTITLTSSVDFPDSGVISIGANPYTYTANNRGTGVLTLSVPSATTNTAGDDAFFGAEYGTPRIFTLIGGYFYHYPVIPSTLANRNYYSDYYKQAIQIASDADQIVLPDPTVVKYYVKWKFLAALNNGEENDASTAQMNLYIARREKMKQKEVIGKNSKFKARINNFAVQESAFEQDDKRSRLQGFIPQ